LFLFLFSLLFQVDFDPSSTTWTASAPTSTGVIVPSDSFSSAPFLPAAPGAATIQWRGGGGSGYENTWTLHPDNTLAPLGYRYLKLYITRETGGQPSSQLVLNEVEFYQGVLAQEQRPRDGFKMKTPRFPAPQMVTCSSFLDQDHHCYKAFDGDRSSRSAWITGPVGGRQHALSIPQWTTFDFGEGRGVRPTAMRIVCNAQNAGNPGGCN
jgi:hypothetical protein